MKEIALGVLASLFFAVTFVLNRSMELDGGSWMWSASLRFLFMVPFLLLIVALRRGLKGSISEMKRIPGPFLVWSFFAFVLFYAPLTFAAAFSPGWLVAGTWQLTIVAGVLLAPLFTFAVKTGGVERTVRHQIPLVSLGISLIILLGVVLIQLPHAGTVGGKTILLGILPIVVAAFAYPLGNRKMMEALGGRLDTFQRVLAMTLASLPFWIVLAAVAVATVGWPSWTQVVQSFIVAVSSGVIATTLFFMATDLARHDQGRLAAVEATQSLEIVFALAGEMILLSLPLPGPVALGGIAVIITGMSLHSFQTMLAKRKAAVDA
ncbi:DMT family transporter [Edaphobacillus lindanitolerans]|uniref:Putative multidrug resistance efflux transporter n=1 Tax=Edaphobacillus lindanitolerans TaxID=550447 RepID=A0A1U7PNR0_9BACI|nr:multidrug resistance efflux transporter family protein [Edaphobacillus lindanitolerans]SIT75671.1 Putative multidrug resistance efflux transporter [Edaphobacillus lindanitolerans]